ncbi:hypothetical protein ABIE69_003265 [Rhodobacteraceae bacterium MBR-64]
MDDPISGKLSRLSKKIIRYHWDSYGKLNDRRTWLVSLVVAASFLLIASLFFP